MDLPQWLRSGISKATTGTATPGKPGSSGNRCTEQHVYLGLPERDTDGILRRYATTEISGQHWQGWLTVEHPEE
jgi:hypothetical protein